MATVVSLLLKVVAVAVIADNVPPEAGVKLPIAVVVGRVSVDVSLLPENEELFPCSLHLAIGSDRSPVHKICFSRTTVALLTE